jgi:hypothetical protein
MIGGLAFAPFGETANLTSEARIEIPNLSNKTRGKITGVFVPDGKALVGLTAVVKVGRETRSANVSSTWDKSQRHQVFTVTIDGKGLPAGDATVMIKMRGTGGGQFKDVALSRTD